MKIERSLWHLVLSLFLVISVHAEHNKAVKIGVITDLSGAGAFWGTQTLLGAELAAKEIKEAGGELQILNYDSQLLPKIAVSAAQRALMIDQVDAVFSDFAAPSMAISELVEQQQKILLYAAAAQSILVTNPYAFKTYLSYVRGCRQLAEDLKARGKVKIAHLKPISEFGNLCAEGIRAVFPKHFELEFNYGDTVASQVRRIQAQGAEAIISMAYIPDLENLVKACDQYHYQPQIYTSTEIVTPELLKKYPSFKGHYVGFGYPQTPESFIVKVKSAFPNAQINYAPTILATYVHIKQLYQMLQQCPKLAVECQAEKLAASLDTEFNLFTFKDREADIPIVLSER